MAEPFQRVPSLISAFVQEFIRVIAKGANHPMWDFVTLHLLRAPSLDFEDIPLFYNLLNSGSPQYEAERLWLLKILSSGGRQEEDLVVLRKRLVFFLFFASEFTLSSPTGCSFNNNNT